MGYSGEGVCLLSRMGPYHILLDCGLHQIEPFLAYLGDRGFLPDLIFCSHAHPDHCRGLPPLHQHYPDLPLYSSEVTGELLALHGLNSQACQALPWRSPQELKPGLSAQIYPAGHLPGAASILLSYQAPERTYTLFYTGDYFSSNSRLVERMRIEDVRGLQPDVLIVEATYGTARHPNRRHQENHLAERIYKALKKNTSVLLPVPVLGLGQELLMLLRSHHQFTGRDIDIWVDETIARGCDAYLKILPHLPANVQNFAEHQSLFWDDRVRPQVRRLSEHDDLPKLPRYPCIIIAHRQGDLHQWMQPNSGDWLALLSEHSKNTPKLALEMEQVDSAIVETYLFSQHCDGLGTTQLIHNIRPQHIIFFHGNTSYLADLTGLEELQNRYHLHCPQAETLVELPVGDTFIQPAAPETHYEGELTEFHTTIQIHLPEEITRDRRWQHFSDTGILEARWQGEELIVRGLSQRELLAQGVPKMPPDLNCCGNCAHYRGQRCWSPASALFEFRVSPDGVCPVFARNPES
ncbi:MBL fold metallo-hydrolase [Roseofilum casamattae]|uniref:MBL fold metallo-hydrolase n=1 Tax=Roseofilum casamattae BLCC-M143 TaxID=3022442 RepID=A0ABT7BXQ1_9CYAN|nr:MBL fold metallo-hydrolase [Roseofilum casamattae BLCC-M143]